MSKITRCISVLFFFSILTGCSSSNTLRYQTKKEVKEEKNSSVRFTSEDSSREGLLPDSSLTEYDEENDPDDLPDETGIDITEVVKNFNSKETGANTPPGSSDFKESVLMEIIKYLNTPYKYGGNSKNGIDCSAFTQTIYANTYNIDLLRSARDQYTQGNVIDEREDLLFGDLVFFNTRKRVKPGHVGIYIGDNLFAHASTKHGVIVSSLDHEYYSKRFMGGRRLDETLK